MKRNKLAIILAVITILSILLCSCSIIDEDTETKTVSEEKTAIPDLTKLSIQEESGKNYLCDTEFPQGNYIQNFSNDDGTFTVEADASIILPETDKLPMWEVKPMQFSQETVTGIFNYLFPEEKPYNEVSGSTKAELENAILYVKNELESGISGGSNLPLTDEARASSEKELSILEEMYLSAPETIDYTVSDGTLVYNESQDCMYLNVFMPENQPERMAVYTDFNSKNAFTDESASSISYINTLENFAPESAQQITYENENSIKNKPGISLQKATELANGIFEAAGEKDIVLFESYVVDNRGTGHVDGKYDAATEYAYKFYYTRAPEGIITASFGDKMIGIAGDTEYSNLPWGHEDITVIVGDEGILFFEWRYPCVSYNKAAEDTKIIDINKATSVFENGIMDAYMPLMSVDEKESIKKDMHINIDKIMLAPVRLDIDSKSNSFIGMYTPAYLFYGSINSTVTNTDLPEYSHTTISNGVNLIFAVNATDGSIINPLYSF